MTMPISMMTAETAPMNGHGTGVDDVVVVVLFVGHRVLRSQPPLAALSGFLKIRGLFGSVSKKV